MALTVSILASAWPASAVRVPTNDEIALLVLANQARAQPSADGGTEAPVLPMLWNDNLAAAAQAHSNDMAENGCYQHNSCNGQSWSRRIGSFYPNWEWIGENIGAGSLNPKDLHRGWMGSPGHRANILAGGYNEFGAAMAIGQDNFGPIPLSTEDFGRRWLIALQLMPTVPAGCVLPREGSGAQQRELLANYFHYQGGAPRSVRALVGSSCIDMTLTAGAPDHGTYRAARALSGSGCVPVVFEAVRSDGVRERWPTQGSILVAIGSGATCAERTTALPSATCGGGSPPPPSPTPTPTATPTPTPPSGLTTVSDAHVVLKPGPADASKAKVQVRLTLGAPAGFDPRAGDLRIRVSFAGGGEWLQTLPRNCSGKPCMVANERANVFTGKYFGGSVTANFLRDKLGRWKMRLAAKEQTLSALAPGPVMVEVALDTVSGQASLMGEMRDATLIAD